MADKPILPLDHHQCHAATAYFHRPWDGPATVLTLDGAGDGICATVGAGRGADLTVHAMTPKFHSPAAWLYSAVTAHLGLKPYEHEYKVMGMAPYGQADYCIDVMRQAFAVEGLKFRNKTGRIGEAIQRWFHNKLYKQRFDDVSAACQLMFEELMVRWVRNAVQATGLRKVTAAGGAFLNVKANKRIREMPEVEALYVYPASDDGGAAVGAAVLGHLHLCGQKGAKPLLDLPRSMYLGLEYTEAEMESAAEASGLPYRRMANPADEVGGMLADGQIVARFSGREEVGPRALGNRSILADPRDLRFIRRLNFAIKQRDFWMPFAASVLEEDAAKYIKDLTGWAFHMIQAFDTTPEGAARLPAGTHPFDRTIRPQVVNDLNPTYREVIRAFKARTGVGGVLNTSFNLHGSPIVGDPETAVDTLKKSDLDALALGPFLVTKADGQLVFSPGGAGVHSLGSNPWPAEAGRTSSNCNAGGGAAHAGIQGFHPWLCTAFPPGLKKDCQERPWIFFTAAGRMRDPAVSCLDGEILPEALPWHKPRLISSPTISSPSPRPRVLRCSRRPGEGRACWRSGWRPASWRGRFTTAKGRLSISPPPR